MQQCGGGLGDNVSHVRLCSIFRVGTQQLLSESPEQGLKAPGIVIHMVYRIWIRGLSLGVQSGENSLRLEGSS